MIGSWNDDEFIYFKDEEIRMMLDIRKYKNEEGNFPSKREFDNWNGSEYGSEVISKKLLGWSNVIEGVGGKIDPTAPDIKYQSEELRSKIETLAEKSLEYEVEGQTVKSPEGVAVPHSHFDHLEDVDLPSRVQTFQERFGKGYVDFVTELGYKHPTLNSSAVGNRPSYDWENVKQNLVDDIERQVSWRRQVWGKEKIPTLDYFDSIEKYPSKSTLLNKLGPKQNWKKELGLREENDASNVDVDPTEWF